MVYELTLKVPYNKINQTIDKLNQLNIFQIFYDMPIDVIKDDNGFGIRDREDEEITINIYQDAISEDALKHIISDIIDTLNIDKNLLRYSIYEEKDYNYEIEDIDLDNSWILSYSTKDYLNNNVIYLDPQAAFGTGLHETTQDCLKIILEHDFSDMNVADLGTGTGILGIAASLKNAKRVLSIDIEPVKREVLHNAELNKITNIQVKQANLLEGEFKLRDEFNWVFLNIGAKETMKIFERHHLFQSKANYFLISGLVEWNYMEVISQFENAQCNIHSIKHSNDWVTILFKKQ